MSKLFGTTGIRGSAKTLFTREFCQKIGVVFGSWLKSKNKQGYLAVAMDPRESSPFIKQHVIQGLASQGWEILDEGVIPTPALNYFIKESGDVAGGLMITGSHITADLNGIKFFINGEEITKIHEVEIENLFAKSSTFDSKYSITPIVKFDLTAREMYLKMLETLAESSYPKWTIVVDTANGTQSEIIFELLNNLKIKYLKTGDCDIQSPVFIPRDTEVSTSFAELSRQVLLNKADLGIGFDVDGDRIIFIDNQGRYLPGDYSCTLIAQHELSKSIVTPINTSDVVNHLDQKIYRTKVGSTHVVEKMKEVGATYGFESNGGGISSSIFYGRDGGSTLIKLLNILKASSKTLAELYDSLPKYFLFKDKLDCPFAKYDLIYQNIRQKYAELPINDLDGLKIDLGNKEWILYRGSGNAPEFRVFVQSPDEKRSLKLGQEGLENIKNIIHNSPVINISGSVDSLHIFDSLKSLPDQCAQVIGEMSQQYIPDHYHLVKNIVISGMGGSALGGRVVAGLERQALKIPITVSTEYHLPNFADEKTLVIVSSYSGNTEETLSALAEARSRGCQIFVITTGGKLAKIAQDFDLPNYIFDPKHNPSGQPRMSLGYEIVSLLAFLSRCQLIQPIKELDRLPDFLRSRTSEDLKSLAQNLINRIPVILASEHLKGAAHAMKNQLNENAKTFAVYFDLPEANHHLMEGLAHPNSNPENLSFIMIDSPHYHPETRRRYQLTRQIIEKQCLPVFDFPISGPNPVFEVLDVIQSGAYLAYFLAQAYGTDPGPIPWVDYLKDQLQKNN